MLNKPLTLWPGGLMLDEVVERYRQCKALAELPPVAPMASLLQHYTLSAVDLRTGAGSWLS